MSTLTIHLEQLATAQLVLQAPDEEPAYLFKHALTQEVTYDSLLLRKRREVHRRVAKAYEQIYADSLDRFAALLAQHFQAAGDDAKTVEYAMRAGDHAARLGAEAEAVAHYKLVLEALTRLPDSAENRRAHIDVLIKRTSVTFASTSPEQSLATLREAESLVEDLVRTDGAAPEDRLRLARVHAWSARMHFFRQERRAAQEDFYRVLPIAQELGDEELAALALTMIARMWVWGGAFDRGLRVLRQILPSMEQRQDWLEWILTASLAGVALAARGDYQAAVAEGDRTLKRAKDLNHSVGICIGYSHLALIHMMGSAIRPALEATRAALQIAVPAGIVAPSYSAWGTRAWAESRLGQHQAARESMAQAEAIHQQWGRHYFMDDWFTAIRIEMALAAGEIQQALTQAEQAMSFVRSVDGKFAEAIIQRVWGEAQSMLNPIPRKEAEAHFSSSLELFLSGGAVLEAARTHVAWGRSLQTLGHGLEARQHFEQAGAQFQASGLIEEFEATRHFMGSNI